MANELFFFFGGLIVSVAVMQYQSLTPKGVHLK